VLSKSAARIATDAKGKAGGNIVQQIILNGPLRSEAGRLKIGDFAFSSQETDAELQTRLSTAPPKRK
jgi:hypothetical protein